MIKLIVNSRLYLVVSESLLLLVCMLLGCEQQNKGYGANSNVQEVKSERLKVETKKVALGQVPSKEEEKTSSKKTVESKKTSKLKIEKTEEEKKVEKEVLKWVRKIEIKCRGGDTNPIGWLIGGELDKIEKMGKSAIPTLIEVFCDKDRKWMMRYFIGNEVLVSFAEKVKDDRFIEILKVLEDRTDHEAARMIAARIIGASKDKRAVESSIKLLETEDNERVRLDIVRELGAFFDEKRAIEPLIKVLRAYPKNNLS